MQDPLFSICCTKTTMHTGIDDLAFRQLMYPIVSPSFTAVNIRAVSCACHCQLSELLRQWPMLSSANLFVVPAIVHFVSTMMYISFHSASSSLFYHPLYELSSTAEFALVKCLIKFFFLRLIIVNVDNTLIQWNHREGTFVS